MLRRFRRNPESAPPHVANEQVDAPVDPIERARKAREEQARRGAEAIRIAQKQREELFGWTATAEANRTNKEPEESQPKTEEPPRPTAEDEEIEREKEVERQREAAPQEAERIREEEERQQQEAARQRREAEQRQREAAAAAAEAARKQQEEAERRRQEQERTERHEREKAQQNPETFTRAQEIRANLIRFNPTLKTFNENHVCGVITYILSERASGTTDWNIHISFHPDKHAQNSARQSSAHEAFIISTALINGKHYPF